MPTPLISFTVAVILALQSVPAASQFDNCNSSIPIAYDAAIIKNSNGMCPTTEERQEARDKIRFAARRQLGLYTCGGTIGWTRIAYLNMSDSSHQCPGDLREVTFDGMRLCARDNSSVSSHRVCTSTAYSSNSIPYSEVCGRVVAYQYGATIAFQRNTVSGPLSIDGYYVDGVTLTHGPVGAREHIWTFATGLDENTTNPYQACPCAINASPTIVVPPFIGDDYFCESGSYRFTGHSIFHKDPLWDGEGCPQGNSCCTFSNPPYFTRQLPASTSDDIELQDCGYHRSIGGSSAADTLIQLIELYVK